MTRIANSSVAAGQTPTAVAPNLKKDDVEMVGANMEIPQFESMNKSADSNSFAERRLTDSGNIARERIDSSLNANPTTARGSGNLAQVGSEISVAKTPTVKKQDALKFEQLQAVQGGFKAGAPDLYIVDNPETFSKPGVLASTIGKVAGRGNGENIYQFTDAARMYTLANNATGKPVKYQTVFKNESQHPVRVKFDGIQYVQDTKSGTNVPTTYVRGKFGGPHATASKLFNDPSAGSSPPRVSGERVVQPGETVVLSSVNQPKGKEIFSMLEFKVTKDGGSGDSTGENKFSLAAVARPEKLKASELKNFESLEAAGKVVRGPIQYDEKDKTKAKKGNSDFSGVPNGGFLGRSNGVVRNGSAFVGENTFDVSQGGVQGAVLLGTKSRNSGVNESGQLQNVLENPTPDTTVAHENGVITDLGRSAQRNEGNYGTTYDVTYKLENNSDKPRTIELYLTSPRQPDPVTEEQKKKFKLLDRTDGGGAFNHVVKINGVESQVRIDKEGEARQVAIITIPPGTTRDVNIGLTNLGNIYPPLGIEFRPR